MGTGRCIRSCVSFRDAIATGRLALRREVIGAGAATHVAGSRGINGEETPRRCNPVATVRRKSCNVQGTSGAAVVPDAAAALARASVIALSSARFACDQSARARHLTAPLFYAARVIHVIPAIPACPVCAESEPARRCPAKPQRRPWARSPGLPLARARKGPAGFCGL
jgi:hypothetical protein